VRRLFKILREPETLPTAVPEKGTGVATMPPDAGPRAREHDDLDALVGTPLDGTRDQLDRLSRCGVETRVTVRGSFVDLPPAASTAARLVLEKALAESSGDGSVDVRLRQDDDEFAVTVYSLPRDGQATPGPDRRRFADGAVRGPIEAACGSLMSRRTSAGWIVSARFPLVA
jgi:hypothetical protein